MRKQTKLVAVLSTAALLAIGASMTSFAAQGWAEEDGTWVYYDKNGDKVTESWKKSGDNWYWLDDNGEMAVDTLVEDDDNYYYVNENGAMVSNQWVAIENEDAGEDDEPDHYWYYFQANGKAYKRSDSASDTSISAKTINGKKYAFDTDGRMLYGWVKDGERQTDDDAWQDKDAYYFGDENDGAMSIGWRLISITDDNAEGAQPGDEFWDEDQDRWFWFKSSGKKQTSKANKTINGKKYGFDEYGRMVANWFSEAFEEGTTSVASRASVSEVAEYSRTFKYFSSPEDGARYTRGWFKVVPGYYLEEDEYDDGADYWYYADGDGELYANEIKTIKGKKYAFNENGRMMDGLVLLQMASKISSNGTTRYDSSDIDHKIADDDGTYPYDTEDNFNETVYELSAGLTTGEYRFYYFGDSDDGSMKTGKETVEIDGENFNFKFKDSSSSKGAGIHGEDDDKLYMGGKLIEADSDDKYQVVMYTKDDATGTITMVELDTDEFLDYCDAIEEGEEGYDEDETTWNVKAQYTDSKSETKFYLVNTSGSMVKNKSAAKNGDDYEFNVDDFIIKSVTIEN